MTSENTPQNQPSFGARLRQGFGSFLKFLLRLAFVVLLAILLGSGIYLGIAYGLPALQRQYIQPVQDNSLRLDEMEAQYEQDMQQISRRQDALTKRLETLEAQSDVNKELFANQQMQLDTLAEAQTNQTVILDELMPLETAVSDNTNALDELGADMETLQSEIEALNQTMTEHSQSLQSLNDENEEQNEQLVEIQRDLQLLWALDLLTRSRLFVEQDNYGLARSATEVVYDRIIVLQEEEFFDQNEVIEQIISYLENALESLPDNPGTAEDALQNAWQLLVLTLPEEQIATPTP
jgi:chromosome segregation ATPase